MKWLQDNPVGLTLAAIGGVLVVLALAMAIVWSLPIVPEVAETGSQEIAGGDQFPVAHQVAAMSEFMVINQKPVFNESRRPEIKQIEEEEPVVDTAIEVKDAPDVRLTGVIITPGLKIASLTPNDAKLEGVMAHEGEALTGEFVGWQVSSVNPRLVVLESRDGQSLELELQVHDAKIKEPPKPVIPDRKPITDPAQALAEDDDEGRPLSRAEQIRQRIAERREELRLEQEAKQEQGGAGTDSEDPAERRSGYQQAIREMMNRNTPKDKTSNDKEDG